MFVSCPRCESQVEIGTVQDASTLCPSCGYSITISVMGQVTSPGLMSETEAAQRPDQDIGSHEDVALPKTLGPSSQTFGRYRILKRIGMGGFGTVFLAVDELLHRNVAIKVPHPGRLASTRDAEQFLHEARAAATLKHPAIVTVYDVGVTASGDCYVVLEYIDGESLDKLLAKQRVAWPRLAEIMAAVADAIHFAHKRGLVHRDLKPSNVLLDKDGHPHVADFGLAIDEESQGRKAGEVAGTPAYMSPEQVRGESDCLDGRSDIWSIGVMTYRMLTGRLPFVGSRDRLFDQVLHREAKPPRQVDDRIPVQLERICLKCIAKSPRERYTTASDVARDLRAWLRSASGKKKGWTLWRAGALIALLTALSASIGFIALHNSDRRDMAFRPAAWNDLLTHEPERLLCREPELVRHSFDARVGQFRVDSTTHALYRLGKEPPRGYRFRVRIHQTEWTGGPGVFFGLQKRDAPESGSTYSYQTVELVRNPTTRDFYLLWTDWEVVRHAGGWISRNARQLAEVALSKPKPGQEHLLEIRAGIRGLEFVRWEDRLIPELATASLDDPPASGAAAGSIGLFNRSGSTTFSDARLMPNL